MKFRITAPFGQVSEIHPTGHTGVDIGIPSNNPIYSVDSGQVMRVVDYGHDNIGKGVVVKLQDDSITIYGHMNEIYVKSGDIVDQTTILGLSGSTGRSFGDHLHFGYKTKEGIFVAPPEEYVQFLQNGGEAIAKSSDMVTIGDILKTILAQMNELLPAVGDMVNNLILWLF